MLQLLPHYIITFGSSSIILVLGALLLGVRIPADEGLRKLRSARGYLSLSYFILASFGFFSYFMQTEAEDTSLLMASTLFIGSYQALLFTMTLLTFIQPIYVRKNLVLRHLTIITIAGIALFVVLYFYPYTVFLYVFYAAIAAYLFQLVYYTRLFRRGYNECIRQLQEYYDEDEDNRLRWVAGSFYGALGIGILALLCIFSRGWFYILFIVIYTSYYAYMVCRFYNYRTDARFVIPVVVCKADLATRPEASVSGHTDSIKILAKKEEAFKTALDKWVREKQYTHSDVNVEEIAAALNTDLNFFRYYFRFHMQTDFRVWRSELRIREAEALLKENPKLAVEYVREITGFNHRANFYRQFQKIIGMTPTDYKKKCLDISKNPS